MAGRDVGGITERNTGAGSQQWKNIVSRIEILRYLNARSSNQNQLVGGHSAAAPRIGDFLSD